MTGAKSDSEDMTMSQSSILPKRDGHTHTEFCPHGSRESTELFIRRAIELGFETYSLTEHPPCLSISMTRPRTKVAEWFLRILSRISLMQKN